jgi:hypothetical protein
MNGKKCAGLVVSGVKPVMTILIACIALLAQEPAKKMNFAVIGVKSGEGVSSGEAEIIADRLRIELFNTGMVTMMERDQMQNILNEQGFQQSGACTDDACMVEIGQLLGVERLISGSIGKLGSMFLLNFRTIDVQTAKIIMVVSQDISGGIEDVVRHLPQIAAKLVGSKSTAPPPAPVVKQKEPEPEAQVKAEEPEPPAVAPAPEPEQEQDGEEVQYSDKKNQNRSGVRFSFGYYPGDLRGRYYYNSDRNRYEKMTTWIGDDEWEQYASQPGYNNVFYKKSLLRVNVYFVIKTGGLLTIDVGPGLMVWNNHMGYDYLFIDTSSSVTVTEDFDWQFKAISPNVAFALNFVKRWYPLKMNVGVLADINFNIIKYKRTDLYDWYTYTDEEDTKFNFNMRGAFGARAGCEILGGEHFGFNVDFQARFFTLKTDIDFVDTYDQKWKFTYPIFGVNTGINLYY